MIEDVRRTEVNVEEKRITFVNSCIRNPNPCELIHKVRSQRRCSETETEAELTNR